MDDAALVVGHEGEFVFLDDGLQAFGQVVTRPGQRAGSPVGAAYEFLDESLAPGLTYWYWPEEVRASGILTWYEPLSVQIQVRPGEHRIYLPLVSRYASQAAAAGRPRMAVICSRTGFGVC